MTHIRVNRLNGDVLEITLTEKEANRLMCNRDLKQCLAKADASSWALKWFSQHQHTHVWWAPKIVIHGVTWGPYKWPYKWVTGVITLLVTGRGPTLHVVFFSWKFRALVGHGGMLIDVWRQRNVNASSCVGSWDLSQRVSSEMIGR